MAGKPDESVDNTLSKQPEEYSLDNCEPPAPDALPSEDNDELASNERVDLVPPHFEDKGFQVQIHGGGAHFKSADKRNCVEMENGKEFHIKLSNMNPYGCDVDVKMARLDGGEYEDVGGWRLVPNDENVAIHNSGYEQGKFVFYASDPGKMEGDKNNKNKENLKSIFEITFSPEAYSIYFRMRSDKGVTNIRVLKQPESARLEDVLRKWKEKKNPNEDISEWCFYDGCKIFRTCMFLRTVADKQNIRKPLLLLKKKEKISVKSSDENEIKEIEINLLDVNLTPLEVLQEKVQCLFGDNELKVRGEQVTEANFLLKCLEADFVEVIKKVIEKPETTPAGSVSRGIELTRGLDVGKQGGIDTCRSSDGYRGVGDLEEKEIFHTRQYRDFQNPTQGFVRYEGDPVQMFEEVSSNPNAPFHTSHDDKVVITIHLVPT